MKQRDAAKLNEEYQRLVRGLAETGVRVPAADVGMAGPGAFIGGGWGVGMLWVLWFLAMVIRWCGVVYCVVSFTVHRSHTHNTHSTQKLKTNTVPQAPDFLLQEAVPGNIRRAEHFISFMKKVDIVGPLWYFVGLGEPPLPILCSLQIDGLNASRRSPL